jgi:lysophospholipase L1-like esterase
MKKSKKGGAPKAVAPAGRRPISRRRRFLFIAVILTVILGGQELLCRWLFPLPEVYGFNRINYTPLDYFSPEFKEARRRGLCNVRIRWESAPDGYAFDHSLNLYGFRGPNFSIAPPRDRPRLLFVGDSFVEGCGAADDDTLPAQFQRALDAAHPAEVINLGVAGADLPEYARLVQDGASLLRPQAVFLVMCANDLPADPMPRLPLEAPTITPRNLWVPRAWEAFVRYEAGLAIPRRWPSGPFPFFAAVPSSANPLTAKEPPANIDPAVRDAMRQGKANPWQGAGQLYEQMLKHDFKKRGSAAEWLAQIATSCRHYQARLMVVYIPHYTTANPLYFAGQNRLGGTTYGPKTDWARAPYRSQQHHLRQVCADLDLPMLDTTDAFIAAEQTRGRLFWPVDGHCNPAGYRLLSEICARFLTDGTLPPEEAAGSPALAEKEKTPKR